MRLSFGDDGDATMFGNIEGVTQASDATTDDSKIYVNGGGMGGGMVGRQWGATRGRAGDGFVKGAGEGRRRSRGRGVSEEIRKGGRAEGG